MYQVFRFSEEKDLFLRECRWFSFEDIIASIENGNVVSIRPHHNLNKYPHQIILSVKMHDGVYEIPAVQEDENTLFLKTAYHSRVATKKFTL